MRVVWLLRGRWPGCSVPLRRCSRWWCGWGSRGHGRERGRRKDHHRDEERWMEWCEVGRTELSNGLEVREGVRWWWVRRRTLWDRRPVVGQDLAPGSEERWRCQIQSQRRPRWTEALIRMERAGWSARRDPSYCWPGRWWPTTIRLPQSPSLERRIHRRTRASPWSCALSWRARTGCHATAIGPRAGRAGGRSTDRGPPLLALPSARVQGSGRAWMKAGPPV